MEGKIEFAPTFKRKPNDNRAYSIKRNPSWTDRILYKCNCSKETGETTETCHPENCRLKLKSYDSNN